LSLDRAQQRRPGGHPPQPDRQLADRSLWGRRQGGVLRLPERRDLRQRVLGGRPQAGRAAGVHLHQRRGGHRLQQHGDRDDLQHPHDPAHARALVPGQGRLRRVRRHKPRRRQSDPPWPEGSGISLHGAAGPEDGRRRRRRVRGVPLLRLGQHAQRGEARHGTAPLVRAGTRGEPGRARQGRAGFLQRGARARLLQAVHLSTSAPGRLGRADEERLGRSRCRHRRAEVRDGPCIAHLPTSAVLASASAARPRPLPWRRWGVCSGTLMEKSFQSPFCHL
jgi:hypothetical protein